ncbi:MAG: peptidylprolyl isomerase [Gammaproteobacteria bacterium]
MTIFTAMARTPIRLFLALTLFAGAATAFAAVPTPAGTTAANAASAAPSATANLPGTPLDQVVAIANDNPILQSSLDTELAQVRKQLQSQGTPAPAPAELRHQVLEHLIMQNLELQAAKTQGIQVTDDDVNRTLSTIASRNNVTLAQLPQALAAQGRNYSAFRRTIHDQLIIHQLEQQAVAANISVSPAEIDNYLKHQAGNQNAKTQYHLAQILIAFPSNPTPKQAQETLAKARQIEAKLKGGANFAATAAAQSAGPQALKGGDLGWMSGAELPTLFTDAVPKLKVGQLSAPIAGAGGYHIVKLIDEHAPKNKSVSTEYHLKHILLKPNPVRNLQQCKALAEKLRKEIDSGKITFAAAAAQYSDDPNSAGNGGDLDWQNLDSLPHSFSAVVPNLKLDTISQPVESAYGWHLIEVVGKRQTDQTKEKRRHDAYQVLFQRKLQDQMAQFKRSLRDQAYIRILDPADAGNGSDSTDQ